MQNGLRSNVSAVGRSPGSLQIHRQHTHPPLSVFITGETHIVKQSYIKLSAAGPTMVETSSGIGGA